MQMSVQELRALVDPFEDDVWWFSNPLTRGEVEQAVLEGRLLDEPIIMRGLHETAAQTRARHVRRVAYFLVHGWTDPLQVAAYGLADGHHRLAAAILRGDEAVEVEVTG